MPTDAASYYDANPDPSSLYQGDVLEGIPVVIVPPPNQGPWILLRPPSRSQLTVEQVLAGTLPRHLQLFDEGSSQTTLADAWERKTELVLSKATKLPVMIVSQTCDIDNRNWIQVAPVHGVAHFSEAKLASLAAGDINFMFFLPPQPPSLVQNSCVDLSQITTVHTSYLGRGNRILHLTANARIRLQTHIAEFYGRPFGFNIRDAVPQSATFICANCFFSLAVVQQMSFAQGAAFGECPGCGVDALWVKFR